MKLTHDRLKALIHYNPASGVFTRNGMVAGNLGSDGYWRIKIEGKDYNANRLAWFYVTGEWPRLNVSYKNGDRADNSWSNLRLASSMQTARRRKASNRLGVKGVRLTLQGRYRATIYYDKRHHYLGTFVTIDAAADAYATAAREHFGEFAA